LILTAAVLLANAVAGERGLIQTARVQREYQHLADSVARLQHENRGLAQQADRLRHDLSAIEELARRELGLIRPGEQLFIITERPRSGP
jgi:cell division protein FtsB